MVKGEDVTITIIFGSLCEFERERERQTKARNRQSMDGAINRTKRMEIEEKLLLLYSCTASSLAVGCCSTLLFFSLFLYFILLYRSRVAE